jgi:hypothetical protein
MTEYIPMTTKANPGLLSMLRGGGDPELLTAVAITPSVPPTTCTLNCSNTRVIASRFHEPHRRQANMIAVGGPSTATKNTSDRQMMLTSFGDIAINLACFRNA